MPSQTIKLHVLEHGYIEAVDAVFLTESGERELVTTTWSDRCYLIEHPLGRLLWDTGSPEAKLLADPWALGDTKMAITQPVEPWLRGFGLTPRDIDFLGFSHMHVDHAGNSKTFATSKLVLGAREHAYAFGPDAASPYYPDDYEALRGSEAILVDDRLDLFGDGSVVVHAAPGHTVGHQILVLALPGQSPLILVGDAFYGPADLQHRRAPNWNVDQEESFRSMDKIERLVSELDARLLIHHDPNSLP